jgi:ClpP class serine protease
MKKAIDAVLAESWAIQPEWLETITSIAEREGEYHGNLQALEARLGRPLGNTMRATVRDGVAVLPVEGPMFRRANLMTEYSGATSYDILARDLTQALDDPSVSAVLLNIDSPGGMVTGASELAAMIAAAKKPVWAYVGGKAASAAYWLASAADRIVAADTAEIGSIGVQAGYIVRDARPGEREIRFVSSQSPLKNASPETEAGARQIQANVDALAQVFIEAVARNRNTTVDAVLQSYGRGAVFVAAEAEKRGMIDAIGTFESTLDALKQENATMDWNKLTAADLRANRADLVAEIEAAAVAAAPKPDVEAIRAEAAAAERARIAEIEALAMPGTEDLVAKFKADGTAPAAAAIEIIKAAKANPAAPAAAADPGAQHIAGLKKTEASLQKLDAGSGKDVAAADDVGAAAAAAIEQARKAGVI